MTGARSLGTTLRLEFSNGDQTTTDESTYYERRRRRRTSRRFPNRLVAYPQSLQNH
jgi:hypothetical protein